ncbi:hypothetical protein [Zoogloea sp.]|uniref:hypothetical protein n=1 Tax=Zoogloea sp. TaxID=49181 RepID=UPI0035B4749C|nr:hypothetical protein [Rhodocyclales bacterium]
MRKRYLLLLGASLFIWLGHHLPEEGMLLPMGIPQAQDTPNPLNAHEKPRWAWVPQYHPPRL